LVQGSRITGDREWSLAAVAISDIVGVFDVTTTVLAVACVLVVAWLGWVAIARFRRNLLKGSQGVGSTCSLDELREMRESGQITQQEYQVLRRQVIDGSGGRPGKPQPNSSGNPNDRMSG
jgi:hypothetical protein